MAKKTTRRKMASWSFQAMGQTVRFARPRWDPCAAFTLLTHAKQGLMPAELELHQRLKKFLSFKWFVLAATCHNHIRTSAYRFVFQAVSPLQLSMLDHQRACDYVISRFID